MEHWHVTITVSGSVEADGMEEAIKTGRDLMGFDTGIMRISEVSAHLAPPPPPSLPNQESRHD